MARCLKSTTSRRYKGDEYVCGSAVLLSPEREFLFMVLPGPVTEHIAATVLASGTASFTRYLSLSLSVFL